MKLKTYHAYSMSEALSAVKSDLGADAVILHTRTFKRGGFLGLWRKTVVEVTATPAAPQQASRSIAAPGARPRLAQVQAKRAYDASSQRAAPSASANASANASPSAAPVNSTTAGSIRPSASDAAIIARPPSTPADTVINDDRERTRRLAIALEEAHRRRAATVTAAATTASSASTAAASAASGGMAGGRIHPAAAAPAAPAARRFLLTSPHDQRTGKSTAKPAEEVTSSANSNDFPPRSASHLTAAMQDELNAIRQMVGQVLQRQTVSGSGPVPAMPQHLFDMYLKLIEQDISDELADQIVHQVRRELDADELDDADVVRSAVLRQLASFIPVATTAMAAADSLAGSPHVVALIGPTGVGKTTTLAKLAATYKLREGRTVGLITADTYRIAAVDQLRTYADILGLPLQVALTPAEMKRSIAALSDRDVILIDTAGRSQRDVNRIEELKRFIAAANPHQVHLVLSSTAGEKVLLQEAEAFSAVGVHNIVLTKLDEAVSFGVLVNVVRKIGKQLSFITTGQEVPDHIEPGCAHRIAELVLNGSLQQEAMAGAELSRR